MTIERVASTDYFVIAKNKWVDTHPIRGRSSDIRPLGDRRRDWEQVVKVDEDTYAYRHHATNVITFHADGRVVINSGGWVTRTTAELLTAYSPFYVGRANNMYWVSDRRILIGTNKTFPVSASTPLTLRQYDSGWEAEDRDLKRRTLNRQKLRDMRKDIKGFTESVEALIKITDGWVHSATMEEFGTRVSSYGKVQRYQFFTNNSEGAVVDKAMFHPYWRSTKHSWVSELQNRMLDIMKNGDEVSRMKLTLMIFQYFNKTGLEVFENGFKFRIEIAEFRAWVSAFLRCFDIYNLEPVQEGCYATNIVL